MADSNMSAVDECFSDLGDIERFQGRALSADDVADADVLLVRSVTHVDASLLGSSRVCFVGTATSGIDHLDVAELARRGVPWSHAPGSNANSVVEYVISAIADCTDTLERLLQGAPVGIIGYGRIGSAVHRRLKALGIDCRAYDPWLTPATDPILTELASVLECPVISIHAELTREAPYPSWHLLGAPELAGIGPDQLLISAGRGAIVDNQALLRRLQGGSAPAVVLDVWEPEPDIERELMSYCFRATPHVAGYSHDGKVLATAMLRQALNESLGLASGPSFASSRNLIELEVPAGLEGAGLIRWLQRQSYNIADDDRRMREQFDTLGFDGLRRDYPMRRELTAMRVSNLSDLGTRERRTCRAMGCEVE